MKKLYPKYEIIEDIGSGLNLNKRGIRRVIKMGIEGKINELIVAYKDRLTRFGYELIENIIKDYSGGRIIILNNPKALKPEVELVNDVMALMNVYVAKMNGLRRYKSTISIKTSVKYQEISSFSATSSNPSLLKKYVGSIIEIFLFITGGGGGGYIGGEFGGGCR